MILVIEDEQYRIKWFQETFKYQEVLHTKNILEATELMKKHSFDIIFLDYDLDDCPSCPTGADLARLIVEQKIRGCGQFIIHSMNQQGSAEIEEVLHENRCFIVWPFNKMTSDEFVTSSGRI